MSKYRLLVIFWALALAVSAIAQYQPGSPWPRSGQNNRNTGLGIGGGSNGLLNWSNMFTNADFAGSSVIGSDGTLYFEDSNSGLYAISPGGALAWHNNSVADHFQGTPAIGADGTIYTAGTHGGVYAYSPAGGVLWSCPTGDAYVSGGPVIGPDGNVYVAGGNGGVYAITGGATGGQSIWVFRSGEPFYGAPAIGSDGSVYVASTIGQVYAISGGALGGSLEWTADVPNDQFYNEPALDSNGNVYVAGYYGGVYALNSSGTPLWSYQTHSSYPLVGPAIASGGAIYVVSEGDGTLYAVSPLGSLLWTGAPVGDNIFNSPVVGLDGTIYFSGVHGSVYATSSTGSSLWSYPTGDYIAGSPAIDATGILYVGGENGGIFAIGTQVNTVPVVSLSVNPTSVVGGSPSIGTVTLSAAAPAGGAVVNVTSSDPSVDSAVATVMAGCTTATFTINTNGVSVSTMATLTAASGGVTATTCLNVLPASASSVTSNPLTAGYTSTAIVTLSGQAGPSGDVVTLSSSNTSVATVGTSVTVPAGATSAKFRITALPGTSGQSVTITACFNGMASAALTVDPADLMSVSVVPTSVVGSGSAVGTVTLCNPAPAGGYVVCLSSGNPTAVFVPTTVFICAGATSATFGVGTNAVSCNTPVTITATLGSTSRCCTLTVVPASVAAIFVSPGAVAGGSEFATGTVVLNAPAGPSGLLVTLSSSNTGVATTPTAVMVAAGNSQASFTVVTYTVATTQSVTLTACANSVSVNTGLVVVPINLYQPPAPWPQFQNNAQFTGQGVGGGANGTIRWSATGVGAIFGGSATIDTNGVTYVADEGGGVYGLSCSGSVLWSTPTGDSFYGSPVIGPGGILYLEGNLGGIYAISSGSSGGTAGTIIWSNTTTGDYFYGSPSIAPNGTIYVAGYFGGVYAISSGTDGNPPGTIIGSYQTGDSFEESVAIGLSGNVFVAGGYGGIYALTSSCSSIGSVQTGDDLVGAPSIGPDGSIYIASVNGIVYALSSAGDLLWTNTSTFDYFYGSPAIGANGIIYVAGGYGGVYAISPTGCLLWNYQTITDSFYYCSPTIGTDGTVYVAGYSGGVYAISRGGCLVWSNTSTGDYFECPAAIGADGAIYVTGQNGGVYAIGTQVNSVAIASLTVCPATVAGGTPSIGTVTLSSPAPAGGDVVSLTSSNPSATVPAIVTVMAGCTTACFTIKTCAVTSSTGAFITATSGGTTATAASATLTIVPLTIASFTLNPTTILGGNSSTGTVTLNGIAPVGGTVITLTNQWPAFVTIPATVTIPCGSSCATFIASTPQLYEVAFTDLITATYGSTSLNSTLTVSTYALQSVTLNPPSVQAGTGSTGTLTLGGPAPTGGWTITLTSANPTYVGVPGTVIVPCGATTATFPITTTTSAPTFSCLISAHDSVIYRSATLNVTSDSITGLTLNPTSVSDGGSSTGTITLKSPAPTGGWVVNVSVGVPSIITVPATVTVPAGASSATFTLATKVTATTYNSGVYLSDGHSGASAVLTVVGDQITSLVLNPSTIGSGGTSTGTITLKSAAPTGGWLVNLSAGIPSLVTMPASVTVAAGATTVNFTITVKTSGTSYTSGIYASDGNSAASANLTIDGDVITSLTLSPTTIGAGGTSTGTITLKTAAPTGGWRVSLSAGIPSLLTLPATVTVPAGSTTVTFSIVAKATGTTYTSGIYATDGNSAASANLTIQGDVILSVSVSPTSVVGGTGATGTVTLKTAAPPGGWLVTLSSAVPSVLGLPLTVVTIPAGQTSATFAITTTTVSSTLNVGVYASDGNSGGSAVLTVTHS